jgi:hypothetical protein
VAPSTSRSSSEEYVLALSKSEERDMSVRLLSKLIVPAILLAIACMSGAADARQVQKQCAWFGKAPLCDGKCPAGWSLVENSGKGCIGTWGIRGTKALCCKIEAEDKPCGPAQFGTEGCPYPSFGQVPPPGKKRKPDHPAASGVAADSNAAVIKGAGANVTNGPSSTVKAMGPLGPCPKGTEKLEDGRCHTILH